MYPTLLQYRYALVRALSILYDHGGFSRRALRSQILETLWRWHTLSEADTSAAERIRIDADTLSPAFARAVRAKSRPAELQYLLFPEVSFMDDESYACVAVAAIERINAQHPDHVSVFEAALLTAIGIAIGLREAESYYLPLAAAVEPDKLLEGAWTRSWIWDSEFGCPA